MNHSKQISTLYTFHVMLIDKMIYSILLGSVKSIILVCCCRFWDITVRSDKKRVAFGTVV